MTEGAKRATYKVKSQTESQKRALRKHQYIKRESIRSQTESAKRELKKISIREQESADRDKVKSQTESQKSVEKAAIYQEGKNQISDREC